MRPMLIGAVLALIAAPMAQAGEAPVKTVAKLDAKDPKYDTVACKAAREKAIDYEEPGLMKKVIGVGGNALVPFAGTAASTALGLQQGGKQDKLGKAVAVACVSDPLNEETPLIAAPKAASVVAVQAPAAKSVSVVAIDAPSADVTPAAAANTAATETVAVTQ
ncbi:hypothetical protein BH10PSE4_BH10PSE4_29550 [soil metagenome]